MDNGKCIACWDKQPLSHKCSCGEDSYMCKQCQKKSIISKMRPNINPSVFHEEDLEGLEGEELKEQQKRVMYGMFYSIYDDSVPGDELYTKNCGITCPICKKRNVQCMLQELMDITFASVVGDYNPEWVLSKMFVNVEKSRKIIKFLYKNWVKNMNYCTQETLSISVDGWTDNTAKNMEIGITNINNYIEFVANKRRNKLIASINKRVHYTHTENSQIIETLKQQPYWNFLKFPDKNEHTRIRKKELYLLLEKERSFHKLMNLFVINQYM